MILVAFTGFWDIIRIPFGLLLSWLYDVTTNYGLALIIFSILLKLIMFPLTAKSKKSSMKMSRLSPRIQALQKKYEGDQQKLNEATQALYKEEGVSMGGSCLWSFIPLLILIPLYTVIREPLVYLLGETKEVAEQIVEAVKAAFPDLFGKTGYEQLISAPLIPQLAEKAPEAFENLKGLVASADTMQGMNFNFLGINLGAQPVWKVWTWDKFDWAHVGPFLIPLLSAGSQMLSMWVSQKLNDSVVTNEKGVQDQDTVKQSKANQTSKMMLYMMPIMSLWIGFTVPAALSLYWFIQGVISLVMDIFLTKHYRKIYDAEDAVRLQKAMEEEAAEAEKERLRAERRAANPDGITQNTSKKKLQQKQQKEAEAAKAAAAKEYAAKKGIVEEEKEAPVKQVMSGIPDRPYAKGRNFKADRYHSSQNTEE